MTKLRHDLMLQIVKLMDAALVTVPFALCWYLYYAQRVAAPLYKYGDYLVVALFSFCTSRLGVCTMRS